MTFTIRRGTNISHWLSQSERRGAERAAFFTADDVALIARMGFDHVRIPIDEEQMWSEDGQPEPEAFSLLDAALDWCEQYELRAVVDLHILRSHYFNDKGEIKLFADAAEAERFAGLWRDLSARLNRRSNDRVAYELLNEAVAEDPQDWNRVLGVAFRAVRELEPERTIVLGSNRWNSALTFDDLEIPEDERLILTFHYYNPMLVTHHQAHWWDGGGYDGPVQYPGRSVPVDALRDQPEEIRSAVEQSNREAWNRERIERDFAQVLAARERTGHPLYCGEFGAYEKLPMPIRLAWYRDMIDLFEKHNIAWANWAYKGDFAIVTDGEPNEIVKEILR